MNKEIIKQIQDLIATGCKSKQQGKKLKELLNKHFNLNYQGCMCSQIERNRLITIAKELLQNDQTGN
jgi:hypothetical protein